MPGDEAGTQYRQAQYRQAQYRQAQCRQAPVPPGPVPTHGLSPDTIRIPDTTY